MRDARQVCNVASVYNMLHDSGCVCTLIVLPLDPTQQVATIESQVYWCSPSPAHASRLRPYMHFCGISIDSTHSDKQMRAGTRRGNITGRNCASIRTPLWLDNPSHPRCEKHWCNGAASSAFRLGRLHPTTLEAALPRRHLEPLAHMTTTMLIIMKLLKQKTIACRSPLPGFNHKQTHVGFLCVKACIKQLENLDWGATIPGLSRRQP